MNPIIEYVPLGMLQTNSFVLGCPRTKEAAIIDCGQEPDQLYQLVKKHDLNVKHILLTHAHFDHIAGLTRLLELLGYHPPISLHPKDDPIYQAAPQLAGRFGIPIDRLPPTDRMIVDQDTITIGDLQGTIHHVPGHCPGHVIFYFKDFSTAFVGDLIFRGSIGRTDLPGCSPDDMRTSLKKTVNLLPPETHLLCGHGPMTRMKDELLMNPYLKNSW